MDHAGTSVIVSNTGNDVAGADYGRVVLYGAGSPPSLTFDGYNRLALENFVISNDLNMTLTKTPDSWDVGTASNVYIDAAGTYDAQAKNSNTFVIKASKEVGTISDWETSNIFGFPQNKLPLSTGSVFGIIFWTIPPAS